MLACSLWLSEGSADEFSAAPALCDICYVARSTGRSPGDERGHFKRSCPLSLASVSRRSSPESIEALRPSIQPVSAEEIRQEASGVATPCLFASGLRKSGFAQSSSSAGCRSLRAPPSRSAYAAAKTQEPYAIAADQHKATMAENIPLLNESMNGARLAGVVDYLRHQKRDVYYGFVGPAREEGQPTNKANQAYFTQRDWLGGETLQRGAEVAFTLSYKDGKPQANDITPVEQDPALLQKKKPQKKPLARKDTKPGKLTLETLSTRVLELVDAEDGELLSANLNRRYRRKYGTDLDFRSLGFERLNQCLREVPGVSVGIGARAVVERAGGEQKPTTTSKKATVTCCYFLRDACDKGDACRYVHQKPLPAGEKCSWGARCRFGCAPQVEKEAPAVTGDLDALCDQVLKLCDQHGSILLANLPKTYSTAYKAKINPRDYGHEKLAHVLQSIQGLHVETGPRGFVAREGDDVQPPPQNTQTEKKPVRVVSEKASPDTLEALSTEILQVIDANEGEVLAAHLPKRYHRTFGKKLVPQDYGCEKLLELLRATPRVGCGSGPRATVTRSAPRAPAAAEDDTDLANPTIDTIEVCDLGAHAPTFTPSAQ